MNIDKKYIRIAIIFCYLLILLYPFRMIVAAVYSEKATRALDDPKTEYLDTLEVNRETLPVYENAVRDMETAIALMPDSVSYRMAAAKQLQTIGLWNATLLREGDKEHQPTAFADQATSQAERLLLEISKREPTNPDIYVALGTIYANGEKSQERSSTYLEAAAASYPINSPLRTTVAMQYLLMGNKTMALHHAIELAKNDTSYERVGCWEMNEKEISIHHTEYVMYLRSSYLYKAMDIVSRASEKDRNMLALTVQPNRDAKEVFDIFLMDKESAR